MSEVVVGLADLPHELQQIVIQHVCIPPHSFADICPQDIATCARLCKYWASIIRHAVWSILAQKAQLHCRVFWPTTPPPHQDGSYYSNIVKHCLNMQTLTKGPKPEGPTPQETHIGVHLSGPQQSGKSTLIGKFVQDKFFEEYDPTIGSSANSVSFFCRPAHPRFIYLEDVYMVGCNYGKNGQRIMLGLLDSAGNEELTQFVWKESFSPRNSHCLFLFVAAEEMRSNPETLKKWALRLKEYVRGHKIQLFFVRTVYL